MAGPPADVPPTASVNVMIPLASGAVFMMARDTILGTECVAETPAPIAFSADGSKIEYWHRKPGGDESSQAYISMLATLMKMA
jgi:hypothetical protein